MELPWQSLLPEQLIYTVVTSRQKPDLSACRSDSPQAMGGELVY
jgi:hypothetical protein